MINNKFSKSKKISFMLYASLLAVSLPSTMQAMRDNGKNLKCYKARIKGVERKQDGYRNELYWCNHNITQAKRKNVFFTSQFYKFCWDSSPSNEKVSEGWWNRIKWTSKEKRSLVNKIADYKQKIVDERRKIRSLRVEESQLKRQKRFHSMSHQEAMEKGCSWFGSLWSNLFAGVKECFTKPMTSSWIRGWSIWRITRGWTRKEDSPDNLAFTIG